MYHGERLSQEERWIKTKSVQSTLVLCPKLLIEFFVSRYKRNDFRPITQQQLARKFGYYSRQTVIRALDYLKEIGFVQRYQPHYKAFCIYTVDSHVLLDNPPVTSLRVIHDLYEKPLQDANVTPSSSYIKLYCRNCDHTELRDRSLTTKRQQNYDLRRKWSREQRLESARAWLTDYLMAKQTLHVSEKTTTNLPVSKQPTPSVGQPDHRLPDVF